MILLTYCCCCIPLNIACYLIAAFFIINNVTNIIQYKSIFDNLGPDPNEDEENKAQRNRVMVAYVIRTILALVVLFTSAVVIFATSMKLSVLLKGAAAVVASVEIFQYSVHLLILKTDSNDWLFTLIKLCLNLYFAAIWLSYALYLEDETATSVSYITVRDDGGQTMQYTLPDDVSRNFQARHPHQLRTAPQTTVNMYPFPVQASAYNAQPGASSGQWLGGQPPPQREGQGQDYLFTPMPTPYGPGFWSK